MIQYLDHKNWKNKKRGKIMAVIVKMTLYQLKLHL